MTSPRTAARRKRNLAVRSSVHPGLREEPAGDPGGPEPRAGGPVGRPRQVLTPRWPAWAGMVLCVAGLGLAAYLTDVHFQGAAPACPLSGGIVDCGAVVTSRWSAILGIPVPVLGLVFFAGMLPLQTPTAWRSPRRLVRWGRLGACAVGIGMILWLISAELFLIGKICIDCTTVHALTFALFCTTLFGTLATSPEPDWGA